MFYKLSKFFLLIMIFILLMGSNSIGAEERIVNLVTLEWPPYIASDLDNKGYLAEVVKEAFGRRGYKVKIDFMPWIRAFSLTERGDYDGLIATYYTPARDELFNFHQEPIEEAEIVLMKLAGREIEYQELEDLKDYVIGINRGFAYPAEFEQADYLLQVETEDTESLLRMLIGKRVDLVAEDKQVLYHLLDEMIEKGTEKVATLEPILAREDLFIAFTASIPEENSILTDFDSGLLEIKEDGTYEQILMRHGIMRDQ